MPRAQHLSKSRFTTGLQCHRLLWLTVHEPDAPEMVPDAATQRLFDQGTRVGALARMYVPGGRLVDLPHDAYDERLAATREALERGESTLYEGTFSAAGVYAAVDILERPEKRIRLIEVKSTTSVKPQHIPDVAIQVHALESSGYEVERAELMHLNRECIHPRLEDLFVRSDVTKEVREFLPQVPELVEEQLTMLAGPMPDVAIGPHCKEPYECPFRSRCWASVPDHHVSTVYYAGKRAWNWHGQGMLTIRDLPDTIKLVPVAERQRRAVIEGRRIVEPHLAKALSLFKRPIGFLDFETVIPAVPVFKGCRPYDQIPVQFSCHRERPGGGYEHVAWLAEGARDPRPEIAARVVAACEGMATVIAYNAPFEKKRIEELAHAPGVSGELAAKLDELHGRIEDLLPVVRDYVYDPEFRGKLGLKSVLPVLVPDLSYDDLEISDGDTASAVLERILLPAPGAAFGDLPLFADEHARLRVALERYCERDTWATVQLFEALEREGKPALALT